MGTCMPSGEPTEPGGSSPRLESPGQAKAQGQQDRNGEGSDPHPPAPGWAWLLLLHQWAALPHGTDLTAWCKMSRLLQHTFHRTMRNTHAFGGVDTQRSV